MKILIRYICFSLIACGVFGQPSLGNQLRELSATKQQSITFQGIVLDQSKAPVSDVAVEVTIFSENPDSAGIRQVTETVNVSTNSNGIFEVTGRLGRALTISKLTKPGFRSSTRDNSNFNYEVGAVDEHRPDRNQPVVFRVWRESAGKAQTLTKHSYSVRLPKDGAAVGLDLMAGTSGAELANSDVLISASVKGAADKPQLILTLAPTNGGIIPGDGFLLEAPKLGYNPSSTLIIKADAAGLIQSVGPVQYFVVSRNERAYAGLEMTIVAGMKTDPYVFAQITSVANFDGARGLDDGMR